MSPDANKVGATERPARGWMWWLLVVSLALNLLVAGLVVGSLFAHRGHHGDHGHWRRGGLSSLSHFVATLPQDRRAALEPQIERTRKELGALIDDLRVARDGVKAELGSEAFDAVKFKADMASALDIRVRARKIASETFTASVLAMTEAERKAFAEWRQQRRRGRYDKKHR